MDVKYLVVHCSGLPIGQLPSAEDIHQYHRNKNGWVGIGYHAVIRHDGTIENGRPPYWQGAHVKGHNHESIGVCLIGRGMNEFTDEQFESLWDVLQQWREMFPDAEVVGHGDLDTAKYYCPGFDVRAWWYRINT